MPRDLLLVEDDDALQRLFKRVLERAGYRVKAVGDLAAARHALFTQPVHVAVMDEVLPDGSGLEFLRERRDEGWRTPVVWVSGFDRGQEVLDRAAEAGVTEVMQKPVRSEDLVQRVTALVPPEEPQAAAPLTQPLEAMLGSTRGGLAVQLGGRVAQLGTVVQAVFEGRETPLAARRYAAAVRARARRSGFPVLAKMLSKVSAELSLLNVADPSDHAGHHARLQTLLDDAAREVPGPDPRSAEASVPRFLVVASRATEAVELMSEAAALGLQLHVVPKVADAVSYAASKPTRGAVLGPVTAESVQAALRLRSATNEAELPVAFLGRRADKQAADTVRQIPGALLLDESLPAGALAAELVDLLQSWERAAAMTALLVDDDPSFVEEATSILKRQGMEVVVRSSVADQSELLDVVGPDLVLVSMNLPDDGGPAFARALRQDMYWRHLPLICTTTEAGPAARAACFAAGANDYLLKPLLVDELVGRAHAWIALSRLRVGEGRRDGLTGLRTRQGTLTELQRRAGLGEPQVAYLVRLEPSLGSFNDTHGFEVGDNLVRALATQVVSLMPTEAVLGRWGGGALIVGVPHSDRSESKARLTQGVTGVAIGEGIERVEAQVSVVEVVPAEGEDMAWALRGAD